MLIRCGLPQQGCGAAGPCACCCQPGHLACWRKLWGAAQDCGSKPAGISGSASGSSTTTHLRLFISASTRALLASGSYDPQPPPSAGSPVACPALHCAAHASPASLPLGHIADSSCCCCRCCRDPRKRATAKEIINHDWVKADGVASDEPLEPEVLTRLKGFAAMNKLKKEALKVGGRGAWLGALGGPYWHVCRLSSRRRWRALRGDACTYVHGSGRGPVERMPDAAVQQVEPLQQQPVTSVLTCACVPACQPARWLGLFLFLARPVPDKINDVHLHAQLGHGHVPRGCLPQPCTPARIQPSLPAHPTCSSSPSTP
jgi:hypothetical protein